MAVVFMFVIAFTFTFAFAFAFTFAPAFTAVVMRAAFWRAIAYFHGRFAELTLFLTNPNTVKKLIVVFIAIAFILEVLVVKFAHTYTSVIYSQRTINSLIKKSAKCVAIVKA